MFSNILGGAAGFPVADLGDTVSQSLRFRGSQRLLGDFASTEWTISSWVKLAVRSGQVDYIWSAGTSGIAINSSAVTWFDGSNFTSSTALLRDPSAWYHIVANKDTVYLNGQTLMSITGINLSATANNFNVGAYSTNTLHLNGYQASFIAIDGQKLDPTAFGRENEDGVWVPKNYTGTYGTNGFHLNFADGSDLGNDVSGNNNDFTANGFDTAAISSSNKENDVDFLDTPTSNWTTLNSLDDTVGVADPRNGNLSAGTTTAADTSGIRATQAVSSGKWYFEVTNTVASGTTNIQAGWASVDTAQRITTSSSNVYGMPIATNSTHMVALDVDSNAIWTGQDGTWDNSATVSEIESGDTTNARHTSVTGYPLAPMWLDQASSFSGTASFNFGQMDFQYTPPTGFSSLQTNNLPEPTIKNGKDHFDVVTWTGDGTSGRDITGLNFQPDFVWMKARSSAYHNRLYDVIRGINVSLVSDANFIDGLNIPSLTAFNSDGFEIGTETDYNQSNETYVAWCWKAGGTAVSNTDGTITSSVSANTDAGFSIVSYTGNLTAGATVGHGLNSAPEFIIVKNRDNTDNWQVKHPDLSSNDHSLNLNTDGVEEDFNCWNNTAPTTSVFSLGEANGSNRNGDDYIAYCWHSVEGFSKFGSYTGLGSGTSPDADGPYTYLGFKPAFLLIKRFDNSFGGEWSIHDTTRSPQNPNRLVIAADIPNNEITQGGIDFLSNGFKIRDGGGWTNQSGGTYVYAAFAENPFGGENAAPATAR